MKSWPKGKIFIFTILFASIAFLIGAKIYISAASQSEAIAEANATTMAKERAYQQIASIWKVQSNRSDPKQLLKIEGLINQVDFTKHPDAKGIPQEITPKLYTYYIDTATQALDKGDLNTAQKSLNSANSYTSKTDEIKKIQSQIDSKKDEIAKETAKKEINKFDVTTGSMALAVTQIEHQDELNNMYFQDGKHEFLLIAAHVKNFGKVSLPTNPMYFSLVVNGSVEALDSETFGGSNFFDAVDVPSGIEHGGWLVFAVPKNADEYQLLYDDGMGDTATKRIIK